MGQLLCSMRAKRLQVIHAITDLAEDGEIAVVWSGRDCDGVRYCNDVRPIPANLAAFDEHVDHTLAYADGPCNYTLMRPSEAKRLRYSSRDLTLEAFENGHQHVIYD